MPWTPRAAGRTAALAAVVLAAVALAGGGGGDAGPATSATATVAPTTAAPPTSAARPKPLGRRDHRLSLTVDGQRRRFLLHTPPGHRRTERLPLVVVLHMARDGADGKTIRDLTGLDATADRERFLVAYTTPVSLVAFHGRQDGVFDDLGQRPALGVLRAAPTPRLRGPLVVRVARGQPTPEP
jgi:hypothetical protein